MRYGLSFTVRHEVGIAIRHDFREQQISMLRRGHI